MNNFLNEISNRLYFSYEILNTDICAENTTISVLHIKGRSPIFNMSSGFFSISHLKICVLTFLQEIWNTVCLRFVKQASIIQQ